MAAPQLFLVDAFNFIFRAFYARQRMNQAPMRTSRGASTEAVYIFHNMIRRLMKDYQPTHFAAVFEFPGKTFRDTLFPAYKATRTETPQELLDQIPMTERLLAAMNIPVLKLEGYEADDLIGTLARRVQENGPDLVIVSSDKDMLQLVNDARVRMLNPMKDDTLYDPAAVEKFMGVPPERITDLLALMGDSVDNIPGAPGIGEKGAVALIQQYGSVEAVLEHAAEIPRKNYRESLLNNRDQVLLSKRLATIAQDAPLTLELDDLAVRAPDRTSLAEMYRELEFFSFLKDLEPAAVAEDQRTERPVHSSAELESWLDGHTVLALSRGAAAEGLFDEPTVGLYSGGKEAVEIPLSLRPTPATAIVYDWKTWLLDSETPFEVADVEDVLLYGFLALSDPSASSFESLCTRFLEGRPATTATAAIAIHDLAERLRPQVRGTPLEEVYRSIDLPLAPVLARMERAGIRVDTDHLKSLASRLESEIDGLASTIYEMAGHPFNISSPVQLGKILFEEMKLPVQGKTGKTRSYSTAADVLETLAENHLIAAKVLEYRQMTKLKGTYIDALPALMDPFSCRVHTTFNPAGAATGRLSSSNPNLQNIPIRTELGREIRAAFVPEPGWVLIAADYSQIELRLLAHFSGDRVLVESFRNGEDIHTRTAAEVFGVPPLMVTPELRRNAKAVNFGIVYGQTPFGLAAQLGIPRDEASIYIRSYFERYAGVKKWIDGAIAMVRKNGYTETLHHRRRPIPDILARNPNARGFAERTAVNTPLQGTAADLIKLAMIAIDRQMAERGLQARMLLQVHDELVLEAPPNEVQAVRALVKDCMERVVKLDVPLLVETGAGPNWRDAK